ncbi:MAG TPA: hydroxyacylglutathione hydrolase [Aliidongia sp.]|uniref:hydroxyacylglutathione hydrolase n=1 Tax=Aliidongia sp. TaxID=1914230 RepID=UPI002DDCD349|nr:hydroxyacylglutathione hydrolase [Aliidongia sp.]HEV2677600.1 hydroxyacylglutathione hydrolase [Aliidongia sp.]
MALEIRLVPLLSDNYGYLLHDAGTGETAVVDPSEAAPVLAVLEAEGWRLGHILNTHHHLDHIGGNAALKAATGALIAAPRADLHRIPDVDVPLAEGDRYRVGGSEAQVFAVPGHTSGHIAFWFEADQALFSGDTLFSLGCGKLFEGTPAEMWRSLGKLRSLPDATRVYCGHEYTQSNARFGLTIERGNPALEARAAEIAALRAAGKPTIPTILGVEKATNPFLRADVPAVQAALGLAGRPATEVFAAIRRGKDNF